jgi:AcrR family transcriptional regulator
LQSIRVGAALNNEPNPKSRRLRRTPEAARGAILESAHRLLIEQGPQAVTLKAIAEAIGMTHGNIGHHFGSSSLLQEALIGYAAVKLSTRLHDSTTKFEAGNLTQQDLISMIFDAFRESGCGRLVAWCSASGDGAQLKPLLAALGEHLGQLQATKPPALLAKSNDVGAIALSILSFALTASLLDAHLEKALHMPEGSLQALAVDALSRGGPTNH